VPYCQKIYTPTDCFFGDFAHWDVTYYCVKTAQYNRIPLPPFNFYDDLTIIQGIYKVSTFNSLLVVIVTNITHLALQMSCMS